MRILLLLVLFSGLSFADQESAKGRLDDCFGVLREKKIAFEQSMGNATAGSVMERQAVKCSGLKKEYLKKYGAYDERTVLYPWMTKEDIAAMDKADAEAKKKPKKKVKPKHDPFWDPPPPGAYD